MIPLGVRSLDGIKTEETPKGGARVNAHLKYDPKVIGMSSSACEAYGVLKLTEIIGRTDRGAPKIEKVRWRDRDAYLVSYELKNGFTVSTTYVPAMGYSIVKSESVAVIKGKKRVQEMEAEPTEHGPNKIWFPAKVSIRHLVDEKQVYKATLQIVDVSFNSPIPPEVFNLIGMEIPKDTEIDLRPATPGSHYWDGEKIVRKIQHNADRDLPPPVPAAETSRRWWFGLSIFLAVAALAAFGWYAVRVRKYRA